MWERETLGPWNRRGGSEVGAGEERAESERYPVPAPVGPGHSEAWYAPEVQAQYELHPGVVATVVTVSFFRFYTLISVLE